MDFPVNEIGLEEKELFLNSLLELVKKPNRNSNRKLRKMSDDFFCLTDSISLNAGDEELLTAEDYATLAMYFESDNQNVSTDNTAPPPSVPAPPPRITKRADPSRRYKSIQQRKPRVALLCKFVCPSTGKPCESFARQNEYCRRHYMHLFVHNGMPKPRIPRAQRPHETDKETGNRYVYYEDCQKWSMYCTHRDSYGDSGNKRKRPQRCNKLATISKFCFKHFRENYPETA